MEKENYIELAKKREEIQKNKGNEQLEKVA